MKKTIIITGASSGIGQELARQYASKLGDGVSLYLLGRDETRLMQIKSEVEACGAEARLYKIDVTKREEVLGFFINNYMEHIDILFLSAGISAGTSGKEESYNQIKAVVDTNIMGSLNFLDKTIEIMQKRGNGQIVLFSSMAGLLGLSSSPIYSATKGAVRMYGQALDAILRPKGIAVSVVIPGFVKTPMTAVNDFPMPFIWPCSKAAKRIIDGVKKQQAIIAFPIFTYILLKLVAMLPSPLLRYINQKLPGKKPLN